MSGASLLALLDDIATILDDVAVMTKVAVKKTAGVLGDDLALNAEQVAGVQTERELPVVWAVAKGSLKNKAIWVPGALVISTFIPWAVVPLLMLGGLYLCLEGAEKLAHRYVASPQEKADDAAVKRALVADEPVDLVALEAKKIKGAIRTDFVLSAEIIIIALGAVAYRPFLTQVVVLITVGMVMTVGVYGFVAVIVKLDDLGLYGLKQKSFWLRMFGKALILVAPKLMKGLTIVGTAAMFLVGGGILAHGLPPLHHLVEKLAAWAGSLGGILAMLVNASVGVTAGFLALGVVHTAGKLLRRGKV